ncbi:Flp pilus assembly protein, protease CpaA [Shewanella psychrophila]|uniref:Flp pilus assembly protein, protease CpaA n=1 Tax=Shewanella psychrophila TaxID=225848 RepID=A0A1S6HRG5_9GAMM|nr:prepilin peptidase [Shewanella psychrophila]AQS38119.1 Flp pilus assembly protein, protease CpaA [Shewanella psychrophila]
MQLTILAIASLLFVLTTCCVSDIGQRRISNSSCLVVLVICIWLAQSQQQLVAGLLSGCLIFFFSLLLFKLRWLAAGDGKLASALGVALPITSLSIALSLTAIFGGILAVTYLIKYRIIQKIPRGEDPGLPYGIAISLGFYIPILARYLGATTQS